MMWGYGAGWGGGAWIVFPIIAVVMMVTMMYFMSKMMGHNRGRNHVEREDRSDLVDEIRSLRREIDELRQDKNKGSM